MKLARLVFGSVILSFALTALPAAAESVSWKSVTAFPRKHPFNPPLDDFAKRAAQYSNNEIKINYIGGPDVTPVDQQMKAVSRGVVDVYYGPMSYFLGEIPEIQAFNGSNLHAMEVRSTGGLALMNEQVRRRLGAELLGYYGSGYTFYVYLTEKPKFAADGAPDFNGMKIRGVAIYREFLKRFGGSAVPMHVAEMYSGLERGLVKGAAWIGPGVTNFGWDKFLKYRLTPGILAGRHHHRRQQGEVGQAVDRTQACRHPRGGRVRDLGAQPVREDERRREGQAQEARHDRHRPQGQGGGHLSGRGLQYRRVAGARQEQDSRRADRGLQVQAVPQVASAEARTRHAARCGVWRGPTMG